MYNSMLFRIVISASRFDKNCQRGFEIYSGRRLTEIMKKVARRENAKLVSMVNKGGSREIRNAEFDESKEADEEIGE